eukprot:1157298-Pelagomonas_calceolata.AAC.4
MQKGLCCAAAPRRSSVQPLSESAQKGLCRAAKPTPVLKAHPSFWEQCAAAFRERAGGAVPCSQTHSCAQGPKECQAEEFEVSSASHPGI